MINVFTARGVSTTGFKYSVLDPSYLGISYLSEERFSGRLTMLSRPHTIELRYL